MKISLILKFVLVIALSFLVIKVILYFYRSSCIETIFWKLERKTTRLAIENEIGKPDTIEGCGDHLSWGGDQANPPKNNGECVVWVRYNLPLQAYAFGYSESGVLVSKYHYVSE